MARKNALREVLDTLIASAGVATVYGDHVKPGWLHCIEHISWEINLATSSGNTRCRLFIDRGGARDYLEEQAAPAANNLYTYNEKQWLGEGERVGLEIDQAQASTTLKGLIRGYRQEAKES